MMGGDTLCNDGRFLVLWQIDVMYDDIFPI